MQARPHISLEVSDLDAAIRFYSLVFRTVPTKQRQDYANYRLEAPGLHLALEYRPSRITGNPFPNQHFGIELFDHDDLIEWRDWLQAVGVSYRVEEQVTCCYAVADKFWLTDPDGHEWEFWVRTEEADQMHGETAGESSGAAVECCVPGAKGQENGGTSMPETMPETMPPMVVAQAITNGAEGAGAKVGAKVGASQAIASPNAQSGCCG